MHKGKWLIAIVNKDVIMAVEWAEARASANRLPARIPEAGRLGKDDRTDARSCRRLSGIAPITARCRLPLAGKYNRKRLQKVVTSFPQSLSNQ